MSEEYTYKKWSKKFVLIVYTVIYYDQNYELQNLKIASTCNINDQAIMNTHFWHGKLEILVFGF